ncbi:phage tail domain-containing protein [Staphylococcus canis]|uniref:Phage tail protein n=1 Tax=Staphylococcus canis TaxID=2724942 RepID=A0ABS0T923_9STAP|nr:phage tail domain-containing protein [Staphylococcus canis]MBI5975213.1 phage tail protein [Staphylococcus canis]
MTNENIIVNNKKIDWLFIERGFKIPSFNFATETEKVPGRPGSIMKRRELNGYEFDLPLIARNDYLVGRKTHDEILNELVKLFNYDEPVKLQLSNKSWHWWAYFDGPIEIVSNNNGFVSFTIKVILTDPYKYANEGSQNTAIQDQVSIVNVGNANVKPHYTLTALKDTPYLHLSTESNKYLAFGEPFVVGTNITDKRPRILLDAMNTLVGWSHMPTSENISDNYSGGLIEGQMTTNVSNTAITPQTYGTHDTGWHGPAIRKSLSKTLQNWKVICSLKIFQKDNKGIAKGFYHFTDEAGKLVASLGLVDDTVAVGGTKAVVQIYDEYGNRKELLNYLGDEGASYNDMEVYLLLQRHNDKFIVKTWAYYKDKNGRTQQHSRLNFDRSFNDRGKQYNRPIRQVIGYVARHSDYPVLPVYLTRLEVIEILDNVGYDYFIKQGDVVEIDTEREVAYVNDIPIKTYKDFASTYFSIDKAHQEVIIHPEKNFDTVVKWQDRWL